MLLVEIIEIAQGDAIREAYFREVLELCFLIGHGERKHVSGGAKSHMPFWGEPKKMRERLGLPIAYENYNGRYELVPDAVRGNREAFNLWKAQQLKNAQDDTARRWRTARGGQTIRQSLSAIGTVQRGSNILQLNPSPELHAGASILSHLSGEWHHVTEPNSFMLGAIGLSLSDADRKALVNPEFRLWVTRNNAPIPFDMFCWGACQPALRAGNVGHVLYFSEEAESEEIWDAFGYPFNPTGADYLRFLEAHSQKFPVSQMDYGGDRPKAGPKATVHLDELLGLPIPDLS